MLLKSADQRIKRSFSESASKYEELSQIQKQIGCELISYIRDRKDLSILDVGMGTGNMTHRISVNNPESSVIGIDFAYGMTDFAKNKYKTFKIINADANNLPFKANSFDIIVSNLAYQWVGDLNSAFNIVNSLLKSGGEFYCSLFTRNTLNELFDSIDNAGSALYNKKPDISRLHDGEDVAKAVRISNFVDISIEREVKTLNFSNMIELVKWLKDTGSNAIEKDLFVGRELLLKANEYYLNNYRSSLGIYASFEVLWIKAKTKM